MVYYSVFLGFRFCELLFNINLWYDSDWSFIFPFPELFHCGSALVKSLKQIYRFSGASCSLFNTSVNYIIESYGNAWYKRFYLIFNVLYKFLYIVFTTVHFQWIGGISISKRTVYTSSRQYLGIDFFCIWCFASFSFSLHLIHVLSLYCSSTGFSMLSKSACSGNETLSWYWPL